MARAKRFDGLVSELCRYGLVQRVRVGESQGIAAHRLVYGMERRCVETESRGCKKCEEGIENHLCPVRMCLLTAITLAEVFAAYRGGESTDDDAVQNERSWRLCEVYSTSELHLRLGEVLRTCPSMNEIDMF